MVFCIRLFKVYWESAGSLNSVTNVLNRRIFYYHVFYTKTTWNKLHTMPYNIFQLFSDAHFVHLVKEIKWDSHFVPILTLRRRNFRIVLRKVRIPTLRNKVKIPTFRFNCWFSFAPVFQWCCSTPQRSPGIGRNTFLSSPHLCFIIVFICDLFVSDELENLHADETTICFEPWKKLRAMLGSCKTGLNPPVFLYWPFQGGTSVVVPYCYLLLLSVFILWFSYYISDIFCKF